MKKTMQSASLMGVLCLSLLSNGFAKDHYNRDNYYRKDQTPAAKEITPPAGAKVTNGCDVFVTADFIYYNAVQSGLPFAYSGILSPSLAEIVLGEDAGDYTVPQGQLSSAASDWTPGFKVGLGMKTDHDNWSIYAEYTYLRARNTTVLSQAPLNVEGVPPIGLVNPNLVGYYGSEAVFVAGDSAQFISVDSITGNWRLSHNKINLDLARYFYVSPKLTMKPFVGMAGAWQTQEFRANSSDDQPVSLDPQSPASDIYTLDIRDTARMQAYALGIRTGLELGWHFTKSFSLQANMSGDALWTNYHTQTLTSTLTYNVTADGSTYDVTLVNMSNPNNYKVNYVADFGLALRYDWLSESQDYGFLIQAGWNAQTWINWGQFVAGDNASGADFSMQGLDVRVRFDF